MLYKLEGGKLFGVGLFPPPSSLSRGTKSLGLVDGFKS